MLNFFLGDMLQACFRRGWWMVLENDLSALPSREGRRRSSAITQKENEKARTESFEGVCCRATEADIFSLHNSHMVAVR